MKIYPGKIKAVLRNRPLPAHRPVSQIAAKAFAAVCLQSPSMEAAFQTELFDKQDQLVNGGENFLFEVAEKVGANLAQVKTHMESETVTTSIAGDERRADENAFKGTPSFLIGNEPVVGTRPLEALKKIIDRRL